MFAVPWSERYVYEKRGNSRNWISYSLSMLLCSSNEAPLTFSAPYQTPQGGAWCTTRRLPYNPRFPVSPSFLEPPFETEGQAKHEVYETKMAETTPPGKVLSPEYLAQDRSPELLHIAVVFTVLEVTFVCLFFTSRIRSKTASNVDTHLMIPAFVFNLSLLGELYCKSMILNSEFSRYLIVSQTTWPSKSAVDTWQPCQRVTSNYGGKQRCLLASSIFPPSHFPNFQFFISIWECLVRRVIA